ncbi:hypothetical protein PCE1_004774 [Barthelona sp. PCE]
MGLFGRKRAPEPTNERPADPLREQAKEWRKSVRKEARGLDREIRNIDRATLKVKAEIKRLVRDGDVDSAKMLAKEVARSNKAVARFYTMKANLSVMERKIGEMCSQRTLMQAMGNSAQIMAQVNSMVKVPELQRTMMTMSREMERAGLAQEMMDDAVEDIIDIEDISDEADAEIDAVMDDIVTELAKTDPVIRRRLEESAKEEVVDVDATSAARLAALGL